MKGKKFRSVLKKNLAIVAVLAILCSLVTSLTPLAQAPEPTTPDGKAGALGWGDDGTLEVGVEWINDFPGTGDDRDHWDESCYGLYSKLVNEGWTPRFYYTDWGAWEEDWKRASMGGFEDSYVDNVDIAMACTHGSSANDACWGWRSSVYFGSTVDDHDLTPCEIYQSYGDKDAEWVAFDSCSVLRDDSDEHWASGMNGLHQLLGFKNTMYVIGYGDGARWAEYMQGWRMCFLGVCWWWRPPYTVLQSWFETTDDLQPGGVCARVVYQEPDNANDYLWGKGYVSADYYWDGDYWYWDHCSCTPPATHLSPATLAQIQTMPVLSVVDRVVNADYVLGIASAFPELAGGEIYSDTENYYMINTTDIETYTLQVDRVTGGYKFRNLTELWASPVETPTLPLGDEALALGNEFFAGAGANLPAAQYRTGDTQFKIEEQVQVTTVELPGGRMQEQELSRKPVQAALSYGREIPILVHNRSGMLQDVSVSVVGPGGRLKMYFGDSGDILGVQGGSRDIQVTGNEVTIMDATKAWDMYLANPAIALAQIPWEADTIEKTGETLGYYENPHLQDQSEMIPTWIFSATFSAEGQALAENVAVYVPAAAEYMPPVVSITAPTSGAQFSPGEMITFSGEVVENGMPPFTYEWSSNHDGFLGSGDTINVALSASIAKGDVYSHTISLEVTDANGQKGTATTTVLVPMQIYLPLTLRH